jgi:galactose mutarotase-like enzyme
VVTRAQLVETTWGPWHAVRLQSEAVAVTVVPRVGGRIVSLLDRRTGREWLTQGVPPDLAELDAWAREDARFDGRASFGWDECLPGVTTCPDPLEPNGPPLRDHGDQWGRACDVSLDADAGALVTIWRSPRWPMDLERRITLVDDVLRADYALTSKAERTLPIVWSAHPTLQLEPGARIELPGITTTRVVGVIGWPFEAGERVPWPEPIAGLDLARVRGIEERAAAKLYASTSVARVVTPDGAHLVVETDRHPIRTIGVWLDSGGWPQDGTPIHQVALEPTSGPHDDVIDALANQHAWLLAPGATLRWWLTVRSVA